MRGDHAIARQTATNRPTLADVFRAHGPAYRAVHKLPLQHLRAMWAIEHCRTPPLGGHLEACDGCDYRRLVYHSCRNRHGPQCQSLDQAHWLDDRRRELLPVPYFHLVFTLPAELRPLALRNQQLVYDLLFRSAADALLQLGQDRLGAQLGAVAVLHTWSQTLLDHPHVHLIVPGGGLSLDGSRWLPRKRPDFLLPVAPLRDLFRGKFLAALRAAYDRGQLLFPGVIAPLARPLAWSRFVAHLYRQAWVVFSKPAVGDPSHGLDYLARYIQRVALSNDRLLALQDDGRVTCRYRDRSRGNASKLMTWDADEFVRRFLCHVLPQGFTKGLSPIRWCKSGGHLAGDGYHQQEGHAGVLSNLGTRKEHKHDHHQHGPQRSRWQDSRRSGTGFPQAGNESRVA